MATRNKPKKTVAKPEYTGLTYGTTGPTNDLIPKEDKRKYNLPPASTANSQDNTRNVESIEEETAVASNAGGQPTAVAPMNMGNLLDIKRDSERPNEDLTAGAFVNNISPTQQGDLDYLVLADLADNSDVDALRQTFSF
jgi:hypothetical protein